MRIKRNTQTEKERETERKKEKKRKWKGEEGKEKVIGRECRPSSFLSRILHWFSNKKVRLDLTHRLLVFYSSGIKAEGGPFPSPQSAPPFAFALTIYVRTRCETEKETGVHKKKKKKYIRKTRKDQQKAPELFSRSTWVENAKKWREARPDRHRPCVNVGVTHPRLLLEKKNKRSKQTRSHTLPHGLTIDWSIRKPFYTR